MIAETSINGFRASQEKHEIQKQMIMKKLLEHPNGASRRMLSVETGIEMSALSARVNELVFVGRIKERGKDKCPITGVTVKWCFFNEKHNINKDMLENGAA